MKKRPRWMSLAGQGFELAGAVLGFGLVGYWIGRFYGDPRIGFLIGALLGIFGGLYNLIRSSLRVLERQRSDRNSKSSEASQQQSKNIESQP